MGTHAHAVGAPRGGPGELDRPPGGAAIRPRGRIVEDLGGNEDGVGETGAQGIEGGLAFGRSEAVGQGLHERPRPVLSRRAAGQLQRRVMARGQEGERQEAEGRGARHGPMLTRPPPAR